MMFESCNAVQYRVYPINSAPPPVPSYVQLSIEHPRITHTPQLQQKMALPNPVARQEEKREDVIVMAVREDVKKLSAPPLPGDSRAELVSDVVQFVNVQLVTV